MRRTKPLIALLSFVRTKESGPTKATLLGVLMAGSEKVFT